MQHDPTNGTPPTPTEGRHDRGRTILAIALIAVGVLALFGNVTWLPGLDGIVGGLLFATLGVAAVYAARRYASDWLMFAAFPAFGLAAAAVIGGDLGGAAFLGGTGAGFLALVVADPTRWWAAIPAGVLFTLSVLTWAGAVFVGPYEGAVFFLGLAATFAVGWRGTARPQPWAVFPAAACLAMALVVGLSGGDWIVPVVLIVIGVVLLVRGRREARG
jgi:hypothetical protein